MCFALQSSAVLWGFFMFVHRKTHYKRNNIQILSNPELNKLKKMDGHMVLTEIKWMTAL